MDFFSLSQVEIEALYLSLKVGFWSVILSLPFGILFGWILSRKKFYGKVILDGFLHLPLVIPPVVTGYLLLIIFGNNGIIGKWLNETFDFTFAFNWKGAVLASAIMSFPLMVRAIRLSIDSVDKGLEDVAKTLGKSNIYIFFTITLPLSIQGIIAGVVLAFARSLGEFGATITFVSNIPGETQTLPIALYSVLQVPQGEFIAAKLCVISIIIAFIALILSEYFSRKSIQKKEL